MRRWRGLVELPFCLNMLEDAVKETDRQDDLRVRDIAEVIAANLVVDGDVATP